MSNRPRFKTQRLLALLLGAALALVLPAPALAKGPIEASIDGPGLGAPLQVGAVENWGEEGALSSTQPIMQLAEAAGFFPAAFAQVPDPMLPRRPRGDLGPRYVITWIVPGPNDEADRIVQDLYPYATPRPVTYMAPGQPLFRTQRTSGGWFAAAPPLMSLLVDAGLSRTPPAGGDRSSSSWTLIASLAVVAAALALGAFAALQIRRRADTAVTP
jgi:hypothetical protein